jgi:glycerol-3-phosphate dehydrogenase
MAADTIDAAVAVAGLQHVPKSPTASVPLVGAAGYAALRNRFAALGREYQLPQRQIERLAFRYGSLLEEVLALGAERPELAVPKQEWGDYLPAELVYAVQAEGALTLTDVLVRRTHLAIELPDGGRSVAADIAALIAPVLGWDDVETARQLSDYLAEVTADRAALEEMRAGARADPATVQDRADDDPAAPNPGP